MDKKHFPDAYDGQGGDDYEGDEAEKLKKNERNLLWAVCGAILLDFFGFSYISSGLGCVIIGILQLFALLIYEKYLGVSHISKFIDKCENILSSRKNT